MLSWIVSSFKGGLELGAQRKAVSGEQSWAAEQSETLAGGQGSEPWACVPPHMETGGCEFGFLAHNHSVRSL